MKRINPSYKINISQFPDDSNQANNNIDDNEIKNRIKKTKTKDKKVIINLDINNQSAMIINSKKSLKKSILKAKKSYNKLNNYLNLETNEKMNKSINSIFQVNHIPYPKSSLNVKNKLCNKSFLNEKDKATLNNKSILVGSNNNKSFHNNNKLNQTKNNFLKLINPNNINKVHKESQISGIEHLEVDSLNAIEKNLQNIIFDLGKNKDFLEFETSPLEVSINKLNIRRKKSNFINKTKKDEDKRKDIISSLKHNTMIHKNIINNNLGSTNVSNSNSEELLLGKKDKTFIFKNRLINNLHNKKNIIKNKNINININNNNKKSDFYKINLMKSNVNGRRSSINPFLKSTHTFKTPINRSKTTSHSKRNSFIDDDYNKLKEDITIINLPKGNKKGILHNIEKFRMLTHRKLVYDSLDDEEVIEDAIYENFFIYPDDKIVLLIDSLILSLTIWNMIYKPLNLVLNNCDVKNNINSLCFDNISNIIIDILFICDLIINFFKAYYNFDEQLVTQSEKIILNYMKNTFIIDAISAIPYYSINKLISYKNNSNTNRPIKCSKYYNHVINDKHQILELFKLIKMIKCISNNNIIANYIVNYLNQIPFFETWSFLMKSIFLTLLILHLTACLHIFISSTTYPNWITYKNLDTSPFLKVYLSSIYFLITTVTSVGYGDITGNSFTEIIFQIFLLMIGIIAYSWLISSISNYVKENNSQNEVFEQKLSILKEIKLEHPKMTKELFDKIYLHLEYINVKQKKDKHSLIDTLPHSVKKPLLYEMYKPIIENFHFFKNFNNSDFVNRVISKLRPVLAVKNDLLLEQGEIIEDTVFVKQGRLGLEVKIDSDHPEKSIEKLLSEEYFFGVENNELYQKSAFGGVINMTTNNYNQTLISKQNLYNLYSGNNANDNNKKEIKPIITTVQGKNEIQKNRNLNINYINLKILDIRKNEHFGALLMFLNKRSPLTLRVKTKKAELYFLKKIDAVEISTSYPNIWKRVNKKSFHNLKEIKNIMKKIIKHFCQTYGIDFDFGTKILNNYNLINTNINKLQKMKTRLEQNVNILNNYNNSNIKLGGIHRLQSLNIYNSQFKNQMLQQFPKETKIFTTKTYFDKNIEQLIPKKFERNKTLNENNLIKNFIFSRKDDNIFKNKRKETFDKNENPIDLSLSVIKIRKKGSQIGDNHHYSNIKEGNNIENNSINSSENHKIMSANNSNTLKRISFKNINQKKSDNNHFKNNSNQIIQKYGEEETNNLIKFFGTPFYPEDINDEVYPGEIFDIISQRNIRNNSYEQEYFPVNNLLMSYDNNINKTKNNIVEPNNKETNKPSNNLTINNNYITNNVINNMGTRKYNGNLSIFNFNLNFPKTNLIKNKNIIIDKSQNFTISKQSFEISYNNNNKSNDNFDFNSINIGNIGNSNKIITNIINKEENNKKKTRKCKTIHKNKIFEFQRRNSVVQKRRKSKLFVNDKIKNDSESFSSDGSLTYSSYSSNSYYNNDDNIFICNNHTKNTRNPIKPIKKIKTVLSPKKLNKNRLLKINQNIIIKINSKYENLNMITDGKFAKSKRLQNCIKNILIKKVLKHKKEEIIKEKKEKEKEKVSISPKKVLKSTIKLVKHKTMAKYIPDKFLKSNLYKVTINDGKLKKTDVKNHLKNILDITDKNSIITGKKNNSRSKDISKISSSSIPKKRKTIKKNDDFLLDYVNRNIRDDNAVLNNPGQFYNGLFNNIIKKATIKPIKKK